MEHGFDVRTNVRNAFISRLLLEFRLACDYGEMFLRNMIDGQSLSPCTVQLNVNNGHFDDTLYSSPLTQSLNKAEISNSLCEATLSQVLAITFALPLSPFFCVVFRANQLPSLDRCLPNRHNVFLLDCWETTQQNTPNYGCYWTRNK